MKKILLVDDSKALRTLIARHLRDQGWTTFEAEDGQAGVLLALQHRPDVILLDVAMPLLDGPAALLKIRTKESIRNTPVIMMTAASDRQTVMKLVRLGIQDYIVKPFQFDVLLEKVEKAYAQHLSQQPPQPPEEKPPAAVAPERPAASGETAPASAPAQEDDPERPNLLLVGLSVQNVSTLRHTLATSYDLFLAVDVEQAVPLSLTYPPDAVILDLNTTQFDPIEGYKRLRYLPHLLRTPLIAIRHPDPVMQDRAERTGMVHFLPDPLDPIALNRLFLALDRERQQGNYGANYIHVHQGVPVLRWPDDMKQERTQSITYEIEDNMKRLFDQGQHRLVCQLGVFRYVHDGHFLVMIAVLRKAAALGMRLAFVTHNRNVVHFFQQFEDTRALPFYPSLGEAWQSLVLAGP